MDELHKTLSRYYGYSSFRPGQERLIRALLAGNDVLGIMPTGAGKSLCYQIPALLLPGLTIVVSPLISLMEDQVDTLRRRGIPAAFVHSAMSFASRRELFRKILDAQQSGSPGAVRLLYVSPERLMTPEFLSFSENANISLLAVDEAHCISNWGRDFRPAYRKIGEYADCLGQLPAHRKIDENADCLRNRPPIGAFTASATPTVREEIIRYLHLKNPESLTTGFDRPNLYFEVRHAEDKWTELLRILKEHRTGSGVIYCLTRKTTEALAKKLNKYGILSAFYHGGLDPAERERNQEEWVRGRMRLIVATCAFGMGIDKPDVRFVIHYNMPGSMENYYQEAGRAGRDGKPGECILLYSIRDVTINKFFIRRTGSGNTKEDFPHTGRSFPKLHAKMHETGSSSGCRTSDSSSEALQKILRQDLLVMQDYVSCHTCLRAFMLRYFGEETGPFCGKCSVCLSDTGPLPQGSTLVPGVESPELYRELRSLRLDLANRQGKLPYEIFSDRTLHDLAAVRPESLKDMMLMEGAGLLNVLKFGPAFLDEIRIWNRTH